MSATYRRLESLIRPLAALFGVLLVFLGIRLMHDTDPYHLAVPLPVGLIGDIFPNPQWVLWGTLGVLAGCALAAFGLGKGPFSGVGILLPVNDAVPSRLAPRRNRIVGLGSGLLTLVFYCYVLVQAPRHDAGPMVLLALAVSMILCGIAISCLQPPRSLESASAGVPLNWVDAFLIVVITLAFIAACLHEARYWLYSFVGDEWSFFDFARYIARGAQVDLLSQNGVYGYHPVVNSAYQAAIMRLFGENVVGWRLSTVLSVALPIAPLYWGAKQMGNTVTAAAAAVCYASCPLLWAYSHIGYNNNDPLLLIIPAGVLFYAGVRRDRPTFLFAAGVFSGLAWYTFFTGRLMIGILVLALLTDRSIRLRGSVIRMAFLIGGFLLMTVPLFMDNGWDVIRQMVNQTSFSHTSDQPAYPLAIENGLRGAYAFARATINDHYVVGDLFDGISACALYIGFAVSLGCLRDPAARLLLIWFTIALIMVAPLYYAAEVPDTRMQVVVPAAALLAGVGISSVSSTLRRLVGPGRKSMTVTASVVILLSAVVLWNGYHDEVAAPRQLFVNPLALTVGALQTNPLSTVVLVGDMSSFNLCQVLVGYQIDPGRVLHFDGSRFSPLCTSLRSGDPTLPTSGNPTLLPRVIVLLSDQMLIKIKTCRLPITRLVQAPNGQQRLWAYRFTVSNTPKDGYEGRLTAALTGRCPILAALPQN